MELRLMCEKVEVTSWGSLDDETPESWEAIFHDGYNKLVLTSETPNIQSVPMAGTAYYFTIYTSAEMEKQ